MALEQKQCLLRYLGYYAGAIDGIWGGGQSQQATIDFQRAYMEQKDVDGIFGAETEKRIREVVASGEKPKESVQIDIGDASYASVYLHFDSYHYATGVDV